MNPYEKLKHMKIVFFGTPDFAVPTLMALANTKDVEILAVVTQKDKPVGRKMKLTPPPVKIAAENLNLPVLQPKNKTELKNALGKLEVDFFIVIAYGMILSNAILQLPKYAPVNIHASLLPRYRGASPIQESLLNGDTETGLSIMKMNSKMDEGSIYLIRRIPILPEDGHQSLSAKLALLSAEITPLILGDIMNGNLTPLPQSKANVSYCHKIEKKNGKIVWNKSATEIHNMIRAYTPWPGAFTTLNGKKITILEAKTMTGDIAPGKIESDKEGIKVGTAKNILLIKTLQPEGKNIMSSKDFLNGLQNKTSLTFL